MLKYRSPVSGSTTTTDLPAPSSRATASATKQAAPLDMPTNIPSFCASIFDVLNASLSETVYILSMTDLSNTSGTNPAPIPWILWGPGFPPDNTGDADGSTAIIFTGGFSFFNAS